MKVSGSGGLSRDGGYFIYILFKFNLLNGMIIHI